MIRLTLSLIGLLLLLMTGWLTIVRQQPATSPPWIIFLSDRNGQIEFFRMLSSGSQQQRLGDSRSGVKLPPRIINQQWVTLALRQNGKSNIYRMYRDNSNLQQLTHNAGNNWFPLWTPPFELSWLVWINWGLGLGFLLGGLKLHRLWNSVIFNRALNQWRRTTNCLCFLFD